MQGKRIFLKVCVYILWNVCVRASGEVLKEFNFKLEPVEKFWCLNEAENCGECVRWDKNIWLDLFSDLPTKSLPGRHSSSDWLDLCQNILHLTSDLHKFLHKPRFFFFVKKYNFEGNTYNFFSYKCCRGNGWQWRWCLYRLRKTGDEWMLIYSN